MIKLMMRRFLISLFLTVFLLVFFGLSVLVDIFWWQALGLSLALAFVISAFFLAFYERDQKKNVVITINAKNMNPSLGLKWYKEELLEMLAGMRFKRVAYNAQQARDSLLSTEDGGPSVVFERYESTGLLMVHERFVEVSQSPYEIEVSCSPMFERMIHELWKL